MTEHEFQSKLAELLKRDDEIIKEISDIKESLKKANKRHRDNVAQIANLYQEFSANRRNGKTEERKDG